MNNEEVQQQIEQPIALAYLSCLTLAMLRTNTKNAAHPENYIADVLQTAELMVKEAIDAQVEPYSLQIAEVKSHLNLDTEDAFIEQLKEMGVPSVTEFKDMIEFVISTTTEKYKEFQDAILKEIESEKE